MPRASQKVKTVIETDARQAIAEAKRLRGEYERLTHAQAIERAGGDKSKIAKIELARKMREAQRSARDLAKEQRKLAKSSTATAAASKGLAGGIKASTVAAIAASAALLRMGKGIIALGAEREGYIAGVESEVGRLRGVISDLAGEQQLARLAEFRKELNLTERQTDAVAKAAVKFARLNKTTVDEALRNVTDSVVSLRQTGLKRMGIQLDLVRDKSLAQQQVLMALVDNVDDYNTAASNAGEKTDQMKNRLAAATGQLASAITRTKQYSDLVGGLSLIFAKLASRIKGTQFELDKFMGSQQLVGKERKALAALRDKETALRKRIKAQREAAEAIAKSTFASHGVDSLDHKRIMADLRKDEARMTALQRDIAAARQQVKFAGARRRRAEKEADVEEQKLRRKIADSRKRSKKGKSGKARKTLAQQAKEDSLDLDAQVAKDQRTALLRRQKAQRKELLDLRKHTRTKRKIYDELSDHLSRSQIERQEEASRARAIAMQKERDSAMATKSYVGSTLGSLTAQALTNAESVGEGVGMIVSGMMQTVGQNLVSTGVAGLFNSALLATNPLTWWWAPGHKGASIAAIAAGTAMIAGGAGVSSLSSSGTGGGSGFPSAPSGGNSGFGGVGGTSPQSQSQASDEPAMRVTIAFSGERGRLTRRDRRRIEQKALTGAEV